MLTEASQVPIAGCGWGLRSDCRRVHFEYSGEVCAPYLDDTCTEGDSIGELSHVHFKMLELIADGFFGDQACRKRKPRTQFVSNRIWNVSRMDGLVVGEFLRHRSRTEPRLRKYPAGSRAGSGGLGRSIFGAFGENGVRGVVAGVEAMLWPPAEERFSARGVCEGDLMLDDPECTEVLE